MKNTAGDAKRRGHPPPRASNRNTEELINKKGDRSLPEINLFLYCNVKSFNLGAKVRNLPWIKMRMAKSRLA